MSRYRPCGVAIWGIFTVSVMDSKPSMYIPLGDGCLLEALKLQVLMPYFFSSYPHSASVLLAPLLWELSTVSTQANGRGFFKLSLLPLLLPTRLVGSTRWLFSLPAFCSLPWLIARWLSDRADHASGLSYY